MRGGFLLPAILCAMLGLALCTQGLRRALLGAALAVGVALAAFAVQPDEAWIEPIFLGCWLSVIASALMLIRPERMPAWLFMAAAANVGVWAGAVTAVAGRGHDLAIALPWLLLLLPGYLLHQRDWGIALKVLASWLTAVAILATMVSLTPTPGYAPDHME